MKKRYMTFLLTVLCTILTVLPVRADSPRLEDGAGLLTQTEAAELMAELDEISERRDVDIVIVTTNGTDGKSMMEYADDYFDYHDYRPDGILLAIDMETRQWWISTTGYGITAMSDEDREWVEDYFVSELSEGNYEEAFLRFADCCDQLIRAAQDGSLWDDEFNQDYDPYFGPSHRLRLRYMAPWPLILLLCCLCGLFVAMISTGHMKRKLKSVRQQKAAAQYTREGSFILNTRQDLYLYRNVTRVSRPKDDDSSSGHSGHSGSSTHTSSSGTTHGGGGGRF